MTANVISRIELGVPYKHSQGPSSQVAVTTGSSMEKWEVLHHDLLERIARLLHDLEVYDGKAR